MIVDKVEIFYCFVKKKKLKLIHGLFFAYQNTRAFKEVAIIHHPHVGEYASGFITSSLVLPVVSYALDILEDALDILEVELILKHST